MKKKVTKIGNSYGIVLSPVLFELMGADIDNLKKTYVDIDFDSNTKTILVNNPTVIEEE